MPATEKSSGSFRILSISTSLVVMTVSSLKQCPPVFRLAVVAVFAVAARAAFDLLPVYQNDFWRQDADQVGALDDLVAFAAAVRRLVGAAVQFERAAAGRFHFQLVEPAADQRPAEARVVVGEL